MNELEQNLIAVKRRIEEACGRCGRNPSEITLVAVTKTLPADRVKQAVDVGMRVFGENYVQEAVQKIEALGPGIDWHFIGHLQRNKVKYIIERTALFHTVDSFSLAEEINKRAEGLRTAPILIQVNISGEGTKSGASPEGLPELIDGIAGLPNVVIRGLMTMPPFFDDPEGARPYFKALRELRDRLSPTIRAPHALKELSMGMTGDFEVAVEEGATIVRVGTALFGARS